MKRTVSLCLVFALLLTLAACGNSGAYIPIASASPTSASSSITLWQTGTAAFNLSRQTYIDTVDPFLEENGYTQLSAMEPTESEAKSDIIGEYISYSYPLDDGTKLYLYDSVKTGDLIFILFYADTSKAAGLLEYRYLIGLTEKALGGATAIDDALNLSNTTEDGVTTANGISAIYVYIVTGHQLQLSIMPQ